ncbi:MAG: ABC transporter ATPase [Rhodospirillales bacterium]|nr:ABC transporter ATPase [Rhodospirillales bacterium]
MSGRLGQRHADVVEAICATALARREIEDGGIELLVDPHQVRRAVSGGRGQYSSEQLHVLLADLRGAVVEIETPELAAQGQRIIGGLLDHWIPSSRSVADPLTGSTRQLWRVRLGVALAALIRADAAIWRDPAPIAALRSGVSQAVARHVLTHSATPRGGWRLDGLLDAVGARADGRARREARAAVRADADGLAAVGIVIDGDRVLKAGPVGVGAEDAA